MIGSSQRVLVASWKQTQVQVMPAERWGSPAEVLQEVSKRTTGLNPMGFLFLLFIRTATLFRTTPRNLRRTHHPSAAGSFSLSSHCLLLQHRSKIQNQTAKCQTSKWPIFLLLLVVPGRRRGASCLVLDTILKLFVFAHTTVTKAGKSALVPLTELEPMPFWLSKKKTSLSLGLPFWDRIIKTFPHKPLLCPAWPPLPKALLV